VRNLKEWIIPYYREFERIRRVYIGKPNTIIWFELDRDRSHRIKSESNPIREYLERYNISYFTNILRSPGIVPIKSCWGIQKNILRNGNQRDKRRFKKELYKPKTRYNKALLIR
jgi:hypothetical protein